jgi:hypothetical protein
MALSAKRMVRRKMSKIREMVSTAETVWQGGLACIDLSTGLVKKGAASTTLRPIGLYCEDKVVAAGQTVLVELFYEVPTVWFANGGGGEAVPAAEIGQLCYIRDDNTVGIDDDTNTLSVAGIVWSVDAVKGVEVQPLFPSAQRTETGLDA